MRESERAKNLFTPPREKDLSEVLTDVSRYWARGLSIDICQWPDRLTAVFPSPRSTFTTTVHWTCWSVSPRLQTSFVTKPFHVKSQRLRLGKTVPHPLTYIFVLLNKNRRSEVLPLATTANWLFKKCKHTYIYIYWSSRRWVHVYVFTRASMAVSPEKHSTYTTYSIISS